MPRTIKIGRSHDNDYIIDNQHVSRHHAEMTITDDNRCALLRDVGSTAGTYVNGKKITGEITVTQNDKIAFGDAIVSFSAIVNINKTRITPSNIESENKITIGRGNDCQIRIQHDDVSTHHAYLNKLADGGVEVVDTNSSNGTFVNGERIVRRVLSKGDKLTITRNYTLNWEQYFPGIKPKSKQSTLLMPIAAAVAGVICLVVVGYFLYQNRSWDSEKIYKKYSDAVCFVYGKYGYKVLIDGQDYTTELFKSKYINILDGKLYNNVLGYSGTGFFISEDGRIATNLHIARSYLFENTKTVLERYIKRNYDTSGVELEVKGYTTYLGVIPNGQSIHKDNFIACSEFRAGDDTNIDVAIIQTVSRSLPSSVKNIVDIREANISEDAITEGRTIYI